jgi:hypothetical protein
MAGVHPRPGDDIGVTAQGGSASDRSLTGRDPVGGQVPPTGTGKAWRRHGGQVATHTGAAAPGLAPGGEGPVSHTLSADGVLRAEKVDEQCGLSSAGATSLSARPPILTRGGFAWLIWVGLVIGVSSPTLLLATAFSPLQTFLKTTSLDARQWLVCLAVALSIVVVSEIRKAGRRHSTPGRQETR